MAFWSLAWLISLSDGGRPFWHVAVFSVSVLVALVTPTSRLAWLTIVGIGTVSLMPRLPEVANHENLALMLGGAFGIALAFGEQRANVQSQLARVALFFLYFWTVCHKLNVDFFDLHVSCATDVMSKLHRRWGIGWPDPLRPMLPWLGILLEAIIGLSVLRWRWLKWGAAAALLLHGFLAQIGFTDFSMIVAVLFWIAFPTPLTKRQLRWGQALILAGLGIGFVQATSWREEWPPSAVILSAFVVLCLGVNVVRLWAPKVVPANHRSLSSRFLIGVWMGLFIFWGSMNYLGLRTAGTFSMFSNLRTEAGHWNHLFIPEKVKFFGYQDEVHWFADLPRELRGVDEGHPQNQMGSVDLEVARLKAREPWKSSRALPSTHEYSWFELNFLQFRLIPADSPPQRCLW